MYCIRHIQNNSGIFNFVFSGICQHIQSYSASIILWQIHSYWDIIQAYSAPCITLAYSRPCHILSPGIFRTGVVLKTLWNVDQHIQNSAIGNYSTIFRHIQNLVQRLHMQNPDILGMLIQNPSKIAFRRIFRALSYLRKFTNILNSDHECSDIFKTRHILNLLKDLRWSFWQKQ